MEFTESLKIAGVGKGDHLIAHTSYKRIRSAFPGISVEKIIEDIETLVTPEGSVIMPAFTYSFKKKNGGAGPFDREKSESRVGAVSEVFRKSEGVVRTSSPSHSFCLWGKVKEEIPYVNNPESPLGKFSVMEWLANKKSACVLMLGVDFTSLTFGHYLEITAPLPWADYSPWDYMDVEKAGVSVEGVKQLKELPGCSNSFVNFEKSLLAEGKIEKHIFNGLQVYYISVNLLLEEGIIYFRNNKDKLLCPAGTCRACDSRRNVYLKNTVR